MEQGITSLQQEQVDSSRPGLVDWVTIFLLIANTANPFFYRSIVMLGFSFAVVFLFWFFRKKEKVFIKWNFLIFIFILAFLQVFQSFTYRLFPINTFLGEYARIGFSMLCLLVLAERFTFVFVRFVIVMASISLVFYFTSILFPSFPAKLISAFGKYTQAPFINDDDGLYSIKNNLIIYNFNQIEYSRNSGFYWEPGTHGGFILLALFVNLFHNGRSLHHRSSIVLIIALITTFSTTSYAGLLFLLFLCIKSLLKQKPVLAMVSVAGLCLLAYILYTYVDFLGKKIEKQFSYIDRGMAGDSRLRSFILDLNAAREHPIIGTGRNIEMRLGSRFYNLKSRDIHRNNGIGILISTYGIPFFLVYMFCLFYSLNKILASRWLAFYGILLLLIISFSEDYFFKVFFYALAFYQCVGLYKVNRHERPYKKVMTGGQNWNFQTI